MTDIIWVASSSVLILLVLAVRAIFGKKLSAGARYALWALVLVRLLIPGTFLHSPVSVTSAVENAEVVQNVTAARTYESLSMTERGEIVGTARHARPQSPAPSSVPVPCPLTETVVKEATPARYDRMRRTFKLVDILNIIWYAGMAVSVCFFIASNVVFYLKLRRGREELISDCGSRVYRVNGLSSSCLFFNTIYVNEEAASDPEKLRFVLAHENAHAKHRDDLIAVLRSAALVLHWYNPLVWAAAYISRRDGELFADAGALRTLGEDERESYGRSLIELSAGAKRFAPISNTATMMSGGKKELKSRISGIAHRNRMSILAAAVVILLSMAAAGCAFLGGRGRDGEPEETPAPAETAAPTEAAAADPTSAPETEWEFYGVDVSKRYEYVTAARKLLNGEKADPVFKCDVYFRLDDDAFRAYDKKTVYRSAGAVIDAEYKFDYSEPIAEYPYEVGEKALKKLYEETAEEMSPVDFERPFEAAEGFAGKDWFVLKTTDDSIQDLQYSCIFRYDGSEWREFGDNNDAIIYPLFGACIVDENVGFLSYFSKFLDEPDGSYRKLYFYRTDDGGKTWTDMGLEIPEEYGYSYPGYACSPVFDGDHGVMLVSAYFSTGVHAGSEGLWYETFDGGRTWEPRELGGTSNQPSADWFAENTLGYADMIGYVNGLDLDLYGAVCEIFKYGADVHYPAKDGSFELVISTGDCSDRELDPNELEAFIRYEDQDQTGMDKWWTEFGMSRITVTPGEIDAAGGDRREAAYKLYAEKLAEKYVGARGDCPAKCREAHVVYCAPYEDDPNEYFIRLAVVPEDMLAFIKYQDFDYSFLFDDDSECRGMMLVSGHVRLTEGSDGAMYATATLDTGA